MTGKTVAQPADFIHAPIIAPLVRDATAAILALWWPTNRTFWRSTEQRAREIADQAGGKEPLQSYFSTVTFRSLDALIELAVDAPELAPPGLDSRMSRDFLPPVLEREVDAFPTSLGTVSGVPNSFTLALYLRLLASVVRAAHLFPETASQARLRLEAGYRALTEVEPSWATSGLHHPFLVFHLTRAVCAIEPHVEQGMRQAMAGQMTAARESMRGTIESILSRERLGLLTPADAVALVFAGGVVAFTGTLEDRSHVMAALNVGITAQDQNGCWPLGRVVAENKDLRSPAEEISTYEIAWAATESLRLLSKSDPNLFTNTDSLSHVDRLVLAAAYAATSVVRLPSNEAPSRGWCCEHPFGRPIVESWTSATVLQQAISLQDLLNRRNRELLLRGFSVADPTSSSWPRHLTWEAYSRDGEMDAACPVVGYLQDQLIQPIKRHPRNLPSSQDRTVSVLLFGPPGTSKTSVAKAVAHGLGWPVVVLSPGNFIERGLEFIEAQAGQVFARLMELSRVLVLFDECDELFREREPEGGPEQMRSISAFVTASMLPKLQDLHDRGQVTFFICTNNFRTIDGAVKRGGRIDHVLAVGPPDRAARVRILRRAIEEQAEFVPADEPEPQYLSVAIETLAEASKRFVRTELVRAALALVRTGPWRTAEEAALASTEVAERIGRSLTIGEDLLRPFEEDKQRYSHAVLEAKGEP